MGDAFDPVWRDAIRCLDPVAVRGGVALPLVCIGDSQRNCGLGGGGILAMQDAVELSKLLPADGDFDEAGRLNLPALRAAEEKMMQRKQNFASNKARRASAMRKHIDDFGRGTGSLEDWFRSGLDLGLVRFFLPRLGSLSNAWYRWDERRLGRVGSDASTTIYPKVRDVLDRGIGG